MSDFLGNYLFPPFARDGKGNIFIREPIIVFTQRGIASNDQNIEGNPSEI
jgi:hypothetical protein